MKTVSDSVPLQTNTIKGLGAADQVKILKSLVPQCLKRVPAIRDVLEIQSSGIVKIIIEGTDEEVVLLALLTAVADDIASVPDTGRISTLMSVQKKVVTKLGLEMEDVQFFIRNLDLVMKALED